MQRMGFRVTGKKPTMAGLNARLQALLSVMPTQPAQTQIAAMNTFFSNMSQVLDTMDVAYFLAAHDKGARNLNIVQPGAFTLTEEGGPPFEANRGFAVDNGGLAGTQYLRTNFVPTTHSTKQTLNNTEVQLFVTKNYVDLAQNSPTECGGNYTQIRALEHALVTGTPTTVGFRVNRAATQRTANAVITNPVGLISAYRSGASLIRVLKNGVSLGAGGGTSVQLDNLEWYIGKANGQSGGSPKEMSFFAGGALLTDQQRLDLYAALVQYLLEIGAYNPADAISPPYVPGVDPYAPGPEYVWNETYVGTALDITGYTLTIDEDFNPTTQIAASGVGNVSEWYAPVRTWNTAQGTYAPVGAAWDPFLIDATEGNNLRVRMAHDGSIWRNAHFQSADTDGDGLSHTTGYWECRMKTPPAGTKGAWPAFWLYATGLYNAPPGSNSLTRVEIDIVELYPGYDVNGHHCTVHLRPGNPYVLGNVSKNWYKSLYTGMPGVINDGDYHTYGCKLDATWLIIYFDGLEVARMPTHPDFLHPKHMLVSMQLVNDEIGVMNVANPVDMWVDYVRYYAPPP